VDECGSNLERDVNSLAHSERTLPFDSPLESLAVDVFEGDIVVRPISTNRVNPCNIFVIKPSRRTSLLVKSLNDFSVVGLLLRNQLDRDLPIKSRVSCTKNRTHSPNTDHLLEQEEINQLARLGKWR
jgi:hypothetical protein